MKRLVFFTIFFVLLSLLPQVALAGGWHSYASEEGPYKVLFPADPTTEVEDRDAGMSYKVSATAADVLFFVGLTIHREPIEGVTPYDLAQVSLESFTEQLGGVTTSEADWKVGKNMGRGATIVVEGQDITMEYRAVLIGQRQYQVVAGGATADLDSKTIKKFIKSFRAK
ncbi:MAG: hypothetical protein HN348_11150 [Proteobacteria bacterium]|jgi:hypothetical protein|nr:hypothetical protein [Pseudomonadota bacterium]